MASCSLACSLGSFTGYSSGGPPDGGNATPPEDGVTDASAPDSATSTDASAPWLFDDFERDRLFGPWERRDESGGELSLDSTTSHSPSRSLRSTVFTGRARRAVLQRDALGEISRAVMTFWMKVPDTTRTAHIARFRLELPEGTGAQLLLETGSDGRVYLAEQRYDESSFTDHVRYELIGFVPDVWQKWTFELDASTTPSQARVTIDDALAREQALSIAFPKGALRVAFGISWTDEGSELSIHYDDVSIAYAP